MKKLNLNKYAYLDYLKGDVFTWLTCNENFRRAAKEDEELRERTPWRYNDEEDTQNNNDFESTDHERYGYEEFRKSLPDQIVSGVLAGEFAELWAKNNYPNHKVVYINKQTNLENLEYTKSNLEYENIIIFEATFTYNDFFIRTDILIKTGNEIKIIEVKGSTSPKLIYGYDLFFQKEIIERGNEKYKGWEYSLLILDKEYIHNKKYSPEEQSSLVFINIDYIANGGLGSRKFKELNGEKVKWNKSTNYLWENKLEDWIDEPVFATKKGSSKIFTFKIKDFLNSYHIEQKREKFDKDLERIKKIQLSNNPPKLEFEKRNNEFLSSDYLVWALSISGAYESEGKGESVFEFRGNTVNFNKKCSLFLDGIIDMKDTINSQITPATLQNKYNDIDSESEELIISNFLSTPIDKRLVNIQL